MMRTNNSKRIVPTNRLPDWDLGVDYVEINAREKSKQILLNHCRKKYSFPCLGAILTKSDRKVVSSADVMHTSAQMMLKIHHHQIGDGYALAASVIW